MITEEITKETEVDVYKNGLHIAFCQYGDVDLNWFTKYDTYEINEMD